MNRHDSNSVIARNGDWRKSLNGALAVIAICGTVTSLCVLGRTRPPLEATIQLERFAASLEHMRSIHPDTVRDLGAMLALPSYDCAQVACSSPVQARNSAARARLKTLIVAKTRPDTFAASGDRVIAASSGHVATSR